MKPSPSFRPMVILLPLASLLVRGSLTWTLKQTWFCWWQQHEGKGTDDIVLFANVERETEFFSRKASFLFQHYTPTCSQVGCVTGDHSCFQSLSLISYLFYSKKSKLLKKEEQNIGETLAYKLLETQTETSAPIKFLCRLYSISSTSHW